MDLDLETQDLTKAVSSTDDSEDDSSVTCSPSLLETQPPPAATAFSRMRQKRRTFGSSALENIGKGADEVTKGAELSEDASPLFHESSAPATNDDSEDAADAEEEPNLFSTNDSVTGSMDGSNHELSVTTGDDHVPVVDDDDEPEESNVPATVVAPPEQDDDEEEEMELEFISKAPSVHNDDETNSHASVRESEKSSNDSIASNGDNEDGDDPREVASEPENTSDREEEEKSDTEKDENSPRDEVTESSDSAEKTPEETAQAQPDEKHITSEKKLPDRQSLITSTDQLFLQVTDRQKVTVKDILQSLQTEYECEKFDKASKAIVRERLVALIQGQVQPLQESDNEELSSSEDEEEVSESEASGAEAEGEESDYEERPSARKKKASKKSPKNKKKKTSTESRGGRIKRKSAAAVKAAAVRVQAEQLRKKRLEELRVRNEELQLLQTREEQKRAAQIAAKLETDTEEIRLVRLEQRLDLLQKLDQKRFAVIQEVPPTKVKEQEKESAEGKQEAQDSDDEAESSEDDMELELVGKPSKPMVPLQPDAISLLSWADRGIRAPAKKDTAKAALTATASDARTNNFASLLNKTKQTRGSPGESLNARAFLKKQLLSQQRRMGNQWLARELGYQNEKEHVEDCLRIENQKRLITLKKEQERIQANERKILRERWLKAEQEGIPNDDEDSEDEDYKDGEEDENDQAQLHDDEEMAMARELNQIENATETGQDPDENTGEVPAPAPDEVNASISREKSEVEEAAVIEVSRDSASVLPVADEGDYQTEELSPDVQPTDTSDDDVEPSPGEESDTEKASVSAVENKESDPSVPTDSQKDEFHLETQPPIAETTSPTDDEPTIDDAAEESVDEKPKGPRNSAWREMLKKEAEKVKKMKKRKGEMIDDEADEEEEEEIVGLEDFGFAMHKKKKKDDDDDNDADDDFDEDDLENVVDDVSDGEGDEEAGEEARKVMELKEEKERHKEIMRRMREGYDGRRGGIAGGGAGARGVHRFDQLVAADNREDAKRLGLLNDDEIDSEDEKEEGGDEEEEDEAALLDKMLKDRFLHRSSVDLEENFSEDEGDAAENDGAGTGEKDEDLEEKEQERMAKRFTKRARMQRLIEAHGHEEEFSQLKLIDEDTTLKEELQKIKNGLVRKRSQSSSLMSIDGSNSTNSSSKRRKVGMSAFASTNGSLAIALQASRRTQKRTSFMRDSSTGSSESRASFQRSVGFKHVVFQSTNSRASSRGASQSQSSVLPGARSSSFSTSSSLWSNVSRGFQKRH